MKTKLLEATDKMKSFWTRRSKRQKGILIGSAAVVLLLCVTIMLWSSDNHFVPLYNDLSVQETSQIKEELDSRDVAYEVEDGGTTIKVPEEDVDSLLVDLAGQGIPDGGNIDYSFFSDNASWGITDNEFDMIKLDAMQTELANLMKGVEGIQDADVMINMPEEPVFVNESEQKASASIVIHTEPGYEFQGQQVNALYHLAAKAVPNLDENDISIMNQYFEYYDEESQPDGDPEGTYTYQQDIKTDIENNIEQRVQDMLGAMVGRENVIVSVTADVDFTEEERVEELVEPVDIEEMEGLPVSIETIEETYEGDAPAGGEPGTGDEDIPNYEAEEESENGDYERSEETINNEYNRIQREIAESPYKIRDLGIQVAVNEAKGTQDGEMEYLTAPEQETVDAGISSILDSIITTTIDGDYDDDVEPDEKTSIVFQEFSESFETPEQPTSIPIWLFIAGGILLLIIIILIVLLLRSRRKERDADVISQPHVAEETETDVAETETEDIRESDAVKQTRQLEKMAEENPEDFAQLLRSWLSDD